MGNVIIKNKIEMKKVWVFISKKGVGGMNIRLYGSFRMMYESEGILINSLVKSERAVRYLFGKTNSYEDVNYYIAKMSIRSKKQSIIK